MIRVRKVRTKPGSTAIWIEEQTFQTSLFQEQKQRLLIVDREEECVAVTHNFANQFFKSSLNEQFYYVLYDVTTLYFEPFKADELKVEGFSKDKKSQQPQIVIGLLVTRSGFSVDGYNT